MDRESLILSIRQDLERTGFYVSEPHLFRGQSFDLVSRRDDTLLVVKVLLNVDAFGREAAEELKLVAMTLKASPVLVGHRSGGGDLEAGVMYSRFGVPIVSPDTLKEFLDEGVLPYLFSAPGGLYVRLDVAALKRLRTEQGLSLGTLAEIGGVSRRTIQMYLEGMAANAEIANRLEEFLGTPLVLPVDPFLRPPDKAEVPSSWELFERFEKQIFRKLVTLGFDVLPTAHSPFEGFASEPEGGLYLTGVGNAGEDVGEKATVIAAISRVAERDFVIFMERRRSTFTVRGTPVIDREDLRRLKDREDLEDMIEERKK